MTERSKIEWCDSTFNPWTGCTKISPACDHCYAESWSKRAGAKVGKWGPGAPRVRTSVANWRKPLKWNARADVFRECVSCGWRGDLAERPDPMSSSCASCGEKAWREARRRVFCASLADVFDNEVPSQWRVDLLELIAATPNLDWLLLTKRIGNAENMLDQAIDVMSHALTRWSDAPWPNVWLGATVCNQPEADRDITKLVQVPAAVRFLSIEPMLGPVDVTSIARVSGTGLMRPLDGRFNRIHWVIAGGESGARARPSHPDWFRSLRDQCADAGVPFLFKQWGDWLHEDQPQAAMFVPSDDGRGLHIWPDTFASIRVGKKAAGRLLDGRTHDGFPESRA